MKKLIKADNVFNESDMSAVPDFNNMADFADNVYFSGRTQKYYTCIGVFVGFNGNQYVALKKCGTFPDISCIQYSNFKSNYQMKV